MAPGTPPEAQSAPANSQIWEALKGESSVPLAKLRRAELVQQEEARLENEARQLRTYVRQARAQALDLGERARQAYAKLAVEKEKLDELGEKVLRGRTSVAAWPGGDRGLIEDPEVAALATQVTMEQEWLVQARATLREVVAQRDLELRRLGPVALLDGAVLAADPRADPKVVQPRPYARRLAKPTKQLGKQEMARVSEALFRGLDGEWTRGLASKPGADRRIRADDVERARRVALEDIGRLVRSQTLRRKQRAAAAGYPALGLTRACRLETVASATSVAASRRMLAKGGPAGPTAATPPARSERRLVLRPVRTEPLPLEAFHAKFYTAPVKRLGEVRQALALQADLQARGGSAGAGAGKLDRPCAPLKPAQEAALADRLYGGAMKSRAELHAELADLKAREVADVRRVRKYGNRPASAPATGGAGKLSTGGAGKLSTGGAKLSGEKLATGGGGGLSTPSAVVKAVEAAAVEERARRVQLNLTFYFACPADLQADRLLEVRLPDLREFTLRVPDEYSPGEEFPAVFPPAAPT